MAETAVSTFRAVADPTRRAILDLLAGGEHSVSCLGDHFEISQPALSQHLRVLRQAELVDWRKEGRKRYYALRPDGLREVFDWVGHYERFWGEKFLGLGHLLDDLGDVKEEQEDKR